MYIFFQSITIDGFLWKVMRVGGGGSSHGEREKAKRRRLCGWMPHTLGIFSKFQIEQSRKLSILDSRCCGAMNIKLSRISVASEFAIPAYIFPNYDNRTRVSDNAAEEGSRLEFHRINNLWTNWMGRVQCIPPGGMSGIRWNCLLRCIV